MQVLDRSNFEGSLAGFLQALQEADFCAVDLEFSGLHPPGAQRGLLADVEERFQSALGSTGSFFPLQVGFCCVSGKKARVFSVYTCPREDDRSYSIQPTSVEFLNRHGFDFGRALGHGVGWLTLEREAESLKRLEEATNMIRDAADRIQVTQDRDKKFVSDLRDLARGQDEDASSLVDSEFQPPALYADAVFLRPVNRFLKRVVYETLEAEFPQLAVISVDDRIGFVRCKSKKAAVSFKKKVYQQQYAEIQGRSGLRRILDQIRKFETPIVTHNGLLDILHLLRCASSRMDAIEYHDFKQLAKEWFPRSYDTKWIAHNQFERDTFESTVLEDLAVSLPAVKLSLLGGATHVEQYHDAGYDAFQTAGVFLGLASKAGQAWDKFPSGMLPIHMSADSINLMGDDVMASREHIVVVFDFPREWRQSNFAKLVAPVQISRMLWESDSCAALILESSAEVEVLLSRGGRLDGCKMLRWHDWRSMKKQGTVVRGGKRQKTSEALIDSKGPATLAPKGLFGWGWFGL